MDRENFDEQSQMRQIAAAGLLALTLLASYAGPRPKYEAADNLSHLNIPTEFKEWRSRDISNEINPKDERFKFIGNYIARQYVNDLGESLLLLILDVNNSHPPANCFKASGFQVEPGHSFDMSAPGIHVTPSSLYAFKKKDGFLVCYWMVINGKVVNSWIGGELRQLLGNILNLPRQAVMIRLDIPINRSGKDKGIKIAQDFVKGLAAGADKKEKELLFGLTA